jgi:hypothetical protein
MSFQSQSKSKEKGMTLKTKEEYDENKDSEEKIEFLAKQFNKMLRRRKWFNKPLNRSFNKKSGLQQKRITLSKNSQRIKVD